MMSEGLSLDSCGRTCNKAVSGVRGATYRGSVCNKQPLHTYRTRPSHASPGARPPAARSCANLGPRAAGPINTPRRCPQPDVAGNLPTLLTAVTVAVCAVPVRRQGLRSQVLPAARSCPPPGRKAPRGGVALAPRRRIVVAGCDGSCRRV